LRYPNGSGEPWKLVDYVKGFNYLTYYGGKFSTSQQRGIFMDAAIDLLPADYWRYALLAAAPDEMHFEIAQGRDSTYEARFRTF